MAVPYSVVAIAPTRCTARLALTPLVSHRPPVFPTDLAAHDRFAQGVALLLGVVGPHGFTFTASAPTRGNDGLLLLAGRFERGTRALAVVDHDGLRTAHYTLDAVTITHDAYMLAVLGRGGSNMFPTFRGDPLDGWRHLAHDLRTYAQVFLRGTDAQFARVAALAQREARRPLHGRDSLPEPPI